MCPDAKTKFVLEMIKVETLPPCSHVAVDQTHVHQLIITILYFQALYNISWNLSQAIGHVCEECGSILTGELFTLHGRVLCEADFKVWMMVLLVLIVILSLLC